jgi:uncharacterized membrane protein YfcA
MNNKSFSMNELLILLGIGLAAGVFSGLAGIGGGMIIVPALVYLIGLTQHQAQGVSLTMFLLPIGFLGLYNYYKDGHVTTDTVRIALIMCTTFIVGSFFGSKIAVSLNQEVLRKVFAGFILLVSLKMLFGK